MKKRNRDLLIDIARAILAALMGWLGGGGASL